MSTKKPTKREPAKKQPEKTKIADSQELSDDDLQEVSGGMAGSPSSGDSCVMIG